MLCILFLFCIHQDIQRIIYFMWLKKYIIFFYLFSTSFQSHGAPAEAPENAQITGWPWESSRHIECALHSLHSLSNQQSNAGSALLHRSLGRTELLYNKHPGRAATGSTDTSRYCAHPWSTWIFGEHMETRTLAERSPAGGVWKTTTSASSSTKTTSSLP